MRHYTSEMNEYRSHLEAYSKHWGVFHTALGSGSDLTNKEKAQRYLEKYWLPSDEYNRKCHRLQNEIFVPQATLPDIVFHAQYEMLAFRGGCLFVQDEFEKLQHCFHEIGDKYFYVIEDTVGGRHESGYPPFRMKYPASISWNKLISGSFISAILFGVSIGAYYVFGETTAWGRYSANDIHAPLSLVGFQPKWSSLFRGRLTVSKTERLEILNWLPTKYRDVIR